MKSGLKACGWERSELATACWRAKPNSTARIHQAGVEPVEDVVAVRDGCGEEVAAEGGGVVGGDAGFEVVAAGAEGQKEVGGLAEATQAGGAGGDVAGGAVEVGGGVGVAVEDEVGGAGEGRGEEGVEGGSGGGGGGFGRVKEGVGVGREVGGEGVVEEAGVEGGEGEVELPGPGGDEGAVGGGEFGMGPVVVVGFSGR